MTSNPLVAPAVDTSTPFQGTFLLEDGEALCTAIESGDWVSGGMAAFSAVMDGISMAVDPIGSLIAAGLGWLMEHLEPLKGWLNDLTGDAGEVAGFAATWTNISAYLATAAGDLDKSLVRLQGFTGAAGDAFKTFHADVAKHLSAAGDWSTAMSTGMELASTIVQMVHDLTRDAIATIVGTAISAAVTTVATLGIGAPAAAAQVATKTASLAGKIGKFVTRLISSIEKLGKLVDDLVGLFGRLTSVAADALRKAPTRPITPAPVPRKLTPAEQFKLNRERGEAYANERSAVHEQRLDDFQREITIKVETPRGDVRIRVDGIGINPDTGKVEILEYKSSDTAPLTPNQRKAFPYLEQNGGTIVGDGKGIFTGGETISPTRVEVERPGTEKHGN